MQTIYLRQIELLTAGMQGWAGALPYLLGEPFVAPEQAASAYKPQLLPPNERRRATRLTRLMFALGEIFLQRQEKLAAQNWQCVFASSGGDYQIIDAMCKDLANGAPISPTQFHNSVHNAVAGYWSIATNGQLASTSISALNDTLAAGLFEAVNCALDNLAPVFLCAYDAPPPPLLAAQSEITREFSTGLLLSTVAAGDDVARLTIELVEQAQVSSCLSASLEALRLCNPAARILPLAELVAKKQNGQFILPFNQQYLVISVHVCD